MYSQIPIAPSVTKPQTSQNTTTMGIPMMMVILSMMRHVKRLAKDLG